MVYFFMYPFLLLQIVFDDIDPTRSIVHPKFYDARVCAGVCVPPFRSQYHNTTLHSEIQAYIQRDVDTSVPSTSCVPTEYGSLSVIMKDPAANATTVLVLFKDIIALNCGCR